MSKKLVYWTLTVNAPKALTDDEWDEAYQEISRKISYHEFGGIVRVRTIAESVGESVGE